MNIGVSLTGALSGYACGYASEERHLQSCVQVPLIVSQRAHKPTKELLATDAAGKLKEQCLLSWSVECLWPAC